MSDCRYRKIYLIMVMIVMAVAPFRVTGRTVAPEEDDDVDIRTGTVDITSDGYGDEYEETVTIPSFIDPERNCIRFNGADWSRLREAMDNIEENPFTIVHIGDSHIQADYATGLTRRLLQYDFGDAGRGLITPLRIIGTNQPEDYLFYSHDLWKGQKLMKQPWKMAMGFTGTPISPVHTTSRISVGTKVTEDEYEPFVSVTLFHHGRLKINKVTDAEGNVLNYTDFPSHDYTQIVFDREQTEVEFFFTCAKDFTLYGASLSGHRPGIFYHTIGNNGATYSTYNNIGTVGRGISPLQPELVIISLGTNEAFGKVNRTTLYDNIDALVSDVRRYNPQAQILLVTPMECQKSVYRNKTKQVKVPSKKRGRKSRTVNKQVRVRTGSYTPNASVATVRDVINRYGADKHIAVYDWYAVAGGDGASVKWTGKGLFSKDHVHHSLNGYKVQGELLYRALKSALVNYSADDYKPSAIE